MMCVMNDSGACCVVDTLVPRNSMFMYYEKKDSIEKLFPFSGVAVKLRKSYVLQTTLVHLCDLGLYLLSLA